MTSKKGWKNKIRTSSTKEVAGTLRGAIEAKASHNLSKRLFNIEQQGSSQQRQQMPEAEQNKASQKQYEGKKYNQKKSWNKNQEPRQRRQYCFFHEENKGHITRDCPDAKETQERIKNRENCQPPPQQPAREVNHTFVVPSQ